MIPEKLEYYILQAILNYVEAQLPGIVIQFRGLRVNNLAGVVEWVAVTCLGMPRRPARVNEWKAVGLFQFSCFSKFADQRPDELADAPYILAGKVARAMEAAEIEVTAVDQNPAISLGCILFHEQQRMEHVDEGELQLNAAGSFDPSGIHAVIMDFPWSFAERYA